MNQPELSERLWDFAAGVGKVVDALPDSRLGRQVAGQLVRSGTSAPPNYDESGAAESRADFVHKLSVALKELRETRGWLRFIVKAELLSGAKMTGLVDEAEQLCRILGKSVLTAKGGSKSPSANARCPMPDARFQDSQLIDLTLTLRAGMRGVAFEPKFNFQEHGWNAQTLHLYSHCGTHMDAPIHSEAGDQTIDEVPLAQCMGPAWLVKLDGIAPKALITVADLGDISTRFAPGDSLLLRTGWSAFVGQAKWRDELPRISLELARWCVEQRVKLLGVEPPSVADVNNLPEVIQIHQTLLGGGVLIVEGLTNLEAITQEKFFFAALPLKPRRGDGSPVRAFAMIGES